MEGVIRQGCSSGMTQRARWFNKQYEKQVRTFVEIWKVSGSMMVSEG